MNTTKLIQSTAITLLLEGGDLQQSKRYARLLFFVPEHATGLTILLSRSTQEPAQLPIALFDPSGAVRIMKASDGAAGLYEEEHTLTLRTASRGGIPGPIPSGQWLLVVYKRRFFEDIELTTKIFAASGDLAASTLSEPAEPPFSHHVPNREKGWYCGELHLHSDESTGRTPVEKVLEVAHQESLDFIALTDHFTASHWLQIQKIYRSYNLLCLQSMEVSGDFGHANIHGITTWTNPLVDDNVELAKQLGLDQPPTMESVADRTHEQGGLFCINHAASGLVAWRYHDFPVQKSDLFEIWCLADGPSTFLYPTLWDTYLCQGIRLTGVGSSDSHNAAATEGPWKLGQIRTWVEADELSQPAIIRGLKQGRAYVSYGTSRMEFHTTYKGKRYGMGDSIPLKKGESCSFSVKLEDNPSGNLFIMIGGQVHDIIHIEGPGKQYCFTLEEGHVKRIVTGDSFVRLEFHEDIVKSRFWGMAYRDHRSMRLLSNPIWFDACIMVAEVR